MNKKNLILLLLIPCILVLSVSFALWAKSDSDKIYSQIEKKWTNSQTIGDVFSVKAVFWNPELVQAWVAKYGAENLLSIDEQTAYHRDFIQRERFQRYLVFDVTIEKLKGPALFPLNFTKNTYLIDDKGNKYYPLEFPREFDDKIFDKVSGKMYFSRIGKDDQPIVGPETKKITLRFSHLSIEPSYVAQEIELTWKDPYVPPDYTQASWQPELEEEILRLQERVILLEANKKELIENQKLIESEIENVKNKIEELQLNIKQ
ncbi:hypothetical protein [Atribacter laminatus]|uniref:Uncharacterized protein n=1 Tax=Atribacter laminatus TaxID=2847778 RepID=A0A7T1F2E3_ATRLM|nr:hypothetical protein [Atribacter laminatus]QPM67680.1 hypothetical protein RT761_00892 [Atribacter laminatus]